MKILTKTPSKHSRNWIRHTTLPLFIYINDKLKDVTLEDTSEKSRIHLEHAYFSVMTSAHD